MIRRTTAVDWILRAIRSGPVVSNIFDPRPPYLLIPTRWSPSKISSGFKLTTNSIVSCVTAAMRLLVKPETDRVYHDGNNVTVIRAQGWPREEALRRKLYFNPTLIINLKQNKE